jgi:hypothetical protein
MKKAIGILVVLILLPFSVHAEKQVFSYRCPKGGIIKPHMQIEKVLELCGEPDKVVQITSTYQKEQQGWGPHKTKSGVAGVKEYEGVNVWKVIKSRKTTVEWERWFYNSQWKKYPVIITFRNGLVERITYGDK